MLIEEYGSPTIQINNYFIQMQHADTPLPQLPILDL